jgi:hypothetical protein
MPNARWAAFEHRDFSRFQGARVLSVLGVQMQNVAIGWQIYAITGRPMDLAWVGLSQFLPAACLSLAAGHVADRFDRRAVLIACHAAAAALSAVLWALARHGGTGVAPIYAVLGGIGTARAFAGPAGQSIVPTLVPVEDFGNAVAWGSSLWQAATVIGPTIGGIAFAVTGRAETVYALAACGSAGALALIAAMKPTAGVRTPEPATLRSLFAGVRYVAGNQLVLGSISLDLFAVLLGGATALLPVYARDVLHLGPWALGVLRSAPAIGGAGMGIALALRPIKRRAGTKMLACVALFGVATVVFAISRNFFLSLAALVVVGAADMVSVFVRSALVQLATPDAMRGRVSAVNMVFVGASNELGEFESGLTAQWLGVVPSVVLGGIGTVAVVAIWAWRFPALRRIDGLAQDRLAPAGAAPAA